jgi:hypothetical protein
MKSVMIKGTDPSDKKDTWRQKLRYFCSQYHWDRGVQFASFTEGDGFCDPTLKLFLYNCYRKFRGWMPIYRLRMLIQTVFRSTHISDDKIWETGSYMSQYCYKMLSAFKNYNRNGYPGIFSEYSENEWGTKEAYDAAIAEGRMIGGGPAAWEKILDHILMALEYRAFEGNTAILEKWWDKHFGMNPWDENYECNQYDKYEFRYKDDPQHLGCHMTFGKPPEDPEKCEYIKHELCFGNSELLRYAEEVVQQGLELMGHYWTSFWD